MLGYGAYRLCWLVHSIQYTCDIKALNSLRNSYKLQHQISCIFCPKGSQNQQLLSNDSNQQFINLFDIFDRCNSFLRAKVCQTQMQPNTGRLLSSTLTEQDVYKYKIYEQNVKDSNSRTVVAWRANYCYQAAETGCEFVRANKFCRIHGQIQTLVCLIRTQTLFQKHTEVEQNAFENMI